MDHNLHGIKRINTSHNPGDSPKTPRSRVSPTFEELLQESDALRWTAPLSGKDHLDHEQDFGHHINIINKKSVLAKMREKARRLKISMSMRRYDVEDAVTPPWGVSLHDEDDEDHFGPSTNNTVPKFEVSPKPQQPPPQQPTVNPNPIAIPVISDKDVLPSTNKTDEDEGKKEDHQEDRKLDSISNTAITLTRSVSKRLAPAINIVSDATSIITSKIGSFAINTTNLAPIFSKGNTKNDEPQTTTSSDPALSKGNTTSDEPQTTTSSEPTLSKGNTTNDEPQTTTSTEKGVSENVKNYLMQKLEPGEDEKALSQVISEAISPKKVRNEMGIMEKVRGAFTALLYKDSSFHPSKQISDQNNNNISANK